MVKVVDAVLHQLSLLMWHEQCQLQAGCRRLDLAPERPLTPGPVTKQILCGSS
jgi:hypothetical protein